MAKPDVANIIGKWALWATKHRTRFVYEQVRPVSYDIKEKMILDCSSFATWCYRQAGAKDPNCVAYNGTGYTGTLVQFGKRVMIARPGDIAIFGPGNGEHAAVVVAKGKDPLLVSHGDSQGPILVHASDDPRPVRYFRFDTKQGWPPREFPA